MEAWDERQHLAACVIYTQKTRGGLKSLGFKMVQQRVLRYAASFQLAPHGIAYAHHAR